MTRKLTNEGSLETGIVIMIIVIILFIVIGFISYSKSTEQCRQYQDTPLSEVPAKCITPNGGVY